MIFLQTKTIPKIDFLDLGRFFCYIIIIPKIDFLDLGMIIMRTVMPPFVGRKKELALLKQLTQKKTSSLVVLTGRRRIGKSRLAQEFGKQIKQTYIFSGLPPETKITAQNQRDDFASQIQKVFGVPEPKANDWGDLFWHVAQQVKEGEVLLVFDEISWMGAKDRTFLPKLKNAWDLYFKNNPQLILILSGSVSSWIEKNILSSTGFFGRVSLDLKLEELTLSESNQFWENSDDRISPYEKLKILSVTGGVPRYLEEIYPRDTAEENIKRLCFAKTGLLFKEFDRIFSDLFSKKANTYKKIVERLVEGRASSSEICSALGIKKGGLLTEHLSALQQAGFIHRDFTWKLENGSESKLSQYRLSDNYLRFYLKYIEPNKSKIESNDMAIPTNWESIIGLQFENLVLNNRKTIHQLLKIDPTEVVCANPFFQNPTKQQAGCQIDYLIQTKYQTLYVCEIKFSKQPLPKRIVHEVHDKISRLARPKGFSVRPVLIHVNGVEESVLEEDYFVKVLDMGELFNVIFQT